ncbi:MAG TPA: hypothetical protein VGP02_13875 [Mycobacteriales bacterium]|nr:hypothetical protein [Mycobacteriales bacterium]
MAVPTPHPPRHSVDAGRRRIPRWLLVAGVLLVLCLGAGGYAVYRAIDRPEDAARTWLGQLSANEYDAAYDGLCDRMRMRMSPADFRMTFAHGERVLGYEVRDVAVRAGRRAEVDVTVSLRGAPGPMDGRLVLVRESGAWKVCDTTGFA